MIEVNPLDVKERLEQQMTADIKALNESLRDFLRGHEQYKKEEDKGKIDNLLESFEKQTTTLTDLLTKNAGNTDEGIKQMTSVLEGMQESLKALKEYGALDAQSKASLQTFGYELNQMIEQTDAFLQAKEGVPVNDMERKSVGEAKAMFSQMVKLRDQVAELSESSLLFPTPREKYNPYQTQPVYLNQNSPDKDQAMGANGIELNPLPGQYIEKDPVPDTATPAIPSVPPRDKDGNFIPDPDVHRQLILKNIREYLQEEKKAGNVDDGEIKKILEAMEKSKRLSKEEVKKILEEIANPKANANANAANAGAGNAAGNNSSQTAATMQRELPATQKQHDKTHEPQKDQSRLQQIMINTLVAAGLSKEQALTYYHEQKGSFQGLSAPVAETAARTAGQEIGSKNQAVMQQTQLASHQETLAKKDFLKDAREIGLTIRGFGGAGLNQVGYEHAGLLEQLNVTLPEKQRQPESPALPSRGPASLV